MKQIPRVASAPGRTYTYLNLAGAIRAIKAGKDINYEGVGGPVDFDQNGDLKAALYNVYAYKDGKDRTSTAEDPEVATRSLGRRAGAPRTDRDHHRSRTLRLVALLGNGGRRVRIPVRSEPARRMGTGLLGCGRALRRRGRGTSLFDGGETFARADVDPTRRIVDFEVGDDPARLVRRISARVVPGDDLGEPSTASLVLLTAWRTLAGGRSLASPRRLPRGGGPPPAPPNRGLGPMTSIDPSGGVELQGERPRVEHE